MIHGIINVYKEKGFTSHDVVAKLRKITGQKKIGHTGTLDPNAEGVLPVCLGKGTKLCELLTGEDKTYEAVLLLGKTTDTQDITGEVLAEKDIAALTEEQVKDAVFSFIGEYGQIPPMYSALKVGGKKLYELARSGTYIRTLCHDIGEKLNCGGCMEKLTRTRVGRFPIEEARTLSALSRIFEEHREEEVVVPVDAMFSDVPKVWVKEDWEVSARNGNPLPDAAVCQCRDEAKSGDDGKLWPKDGVRVRLYGQDGRFIALYRYREEAGEYHLEKMFFPEI